MIKVGKPCHSACETEKIKEVFDSGCLTGKCEIVREYERDFADACDAKHAIATSSGTTALHTALLALDIKEGDEVIVPDYTFVASAFAIMHCGAIPILADVKRDTFGIDIEDMQRKITKRTKAAMVVNQYGLPVDIDELMEIARKNDLRVIGDTATGLGSEYKGKKAGSFFDCECFSTFPTKIISTGEGGMLTTNNMGISEDARAIIDFGRTKKGGVTRLGYNYRLSAIQAAIGICQLKELSKFIKKRRTIAQYYNKRIEEIDWLTPQYEPRDRKSAWQRFVCIVPLKRKASLRDDIIAYMKEQGVECTRGNDALHQMDYFESYYFPRVDCVNSAYVYRHAIALPMHYGMSKNDVNSIIKKMVEFRKKK
ncbi:MAG: DegT/DnrJ/EryC1/StrS family aminotransferase [Methanomicrobia archaeon]|nr:DegT/DnrJ/EryC1/StrS family aminotransferase [Methanomicrobia archaeon]